ncbi:MAG: hypothetical protein KAH16_00535 [Candidatus Izimaplasma sp.]|nr:hypothetical protein [Candidatus Izimaplasma bacterium]
MDQKSKLTCPVCGHTTELTMPVEECIYFYRCTACDELIKPLPGDGCVFCSYGDTPCPSAQEERGCC